MDAWDISKAPDYAPFMAKVKAARANIRRNSGTPELVAATILQAATDPSDRLRYLVGSDAKRFAPLRRLLGSRLQMQLLRRVFKL